MTHPSRFLRLLAALCALAVPPLAAQTAPAAPAAGVKTGAPAPDFTLKGADGRSYKLSDYKGEVIVLEWLNHDCPINARHYLDGEKGNLPQLQRLAKEKGVQWFSIISSAPGQQGYQDAAGATSEGIKYKAIPAAILLDPDGAVGKLYDAKATPQLFVIDKTGVVRYQGAIDSAAKDGLNTTSMTTADLAKATPWFKNALLLVVDGKAVPAADATTAPYGCTVKYAN